MILLWGVPGDSPLDRVREALRRRGASTLFFDQRDAAATGIDLDADPDGAVSAKITVGDVPTSLDDADAVYWRSYDVRRLPHADGDELGAAISVEEALSVWLETTAALVVNRPSAMASNGSKPYQSQLLREQGFDVPRTLITTDPEAAQRFWTDCGAVIYKSISGTRSVVSRLTEAHAARMGDLGACPTQFQQYVPGRDFRVHVVGAEVFATEIVCGADDYRYADDRDEARLLASSVPEDVAERCVNTTRALGLSISGIDLRRAPDGRWFCFEVNPSPGFSYYESHTGQPIADAIARLLIAA